MRRCQVCGKAVKVAESSRPRPAVYADRHGVPFMYLLIFECSCQATLSVCLWQDEQCTADELAECAAEAAAAELYEREEASLERAATTHAFC